MTVAAPSAAVGTVTRPVGALIVAPPPATLKLRSAPAKAAAASTASTEPCSALTSASAATAVGGTWVTSSAAVTAAALPAALLAVTRQVSGFSSCPGPGTKLAAVAPGISTPALSHCSASVGAGIPPQVPGDTVTAAPIRPLPASAGAVTSTGIVARTLTRNSLVALPPELLAVTVIGSASKIAPVAMVTRPVALSIVAPAPAHGERERVALRRPPPPRRSSGAVPASSTRSGSPPVATGAARVTATAGGHRLGACRPGSWR